MGMAVTDSVKSSISAKFNIQALIDALEVVGETPHIRFGYGKLDPTTPTLLILNADFRMFGEPLVMVPPDTPC